MLTLKNFDRVLVSYLYEPDEIVAKVKYVPEPVAEGEEPTGKMVPTAVLETIKGQKKGVVVALGAGILGWSLCNTSEGYIPGKGYHSGDVFDKEKGLSLALTRANIAATLNPVNRESFYDKVPQTILDLFEQVEFRAEKYFTPKDGSVEE